MAKKLAYERYYWFQGQIKAGQYPNAKKLSEKFEISQKQAQRDIEFMRDRLTAPLVYDSGRRGYEYEDNSYELPPIWFKEDELLALCLALRLASTLPDRKLKESLYQLLEKFLSFRFLDFPPSIGDIKEKVSVKNVEYYKVDETVFHRVVDSIFRNEPLRISYHTPHKDETTQRVIQPLHLLCYMGSWHLIAFCTLKGELRDFALSRIRTIEPVSQIVKLPKRLTSVKDYINKNFGLMSGGESVEVCLKFAPEVSHWISGAGLVQRPGSLIERRRECMFEVSGCRLQGSQEGNPQIRCQRGGLVSSGIKGRNQARNCQDVGGLQSWTSIKNHPLPWRGGD